MVTKARSVSGGDEKTNFIASTASQIWLAGLGAFSLAQQEGSKMFETLIAEGERFEQQTLKMTTQKVEEVKDKVEEVRGRANEQLDKLEQAFQNRVSRALNRLGVPTNEDIRDLMEQVEALNASIIELGNAQSAPVNSKRRDMEVTS